MEGTFVISPPNAKRSKMKAIQEVSLVSLTLKARSVEVKQK